MRLLKEINWAYAAGMLAYCVAVGVLATPPKPLHASVVKDSLTTAPPAKTSDSPVTPPVAEAKDGIPNGHRLLYKIARARAAGELADKEKISRRAAREKIDDAVSDAQLHELATTAGLTIKAQASGGKVSDFLDWLAAHSDQIMALVKLIMSLFAS